MNKNDYPFQPGDMVKAKDDFVDERRVYQLPYPKKGQYLTVSECLQHEFDENVFLLFFEDLKMSIPLAACRFELVQTERDGDSVLNEAYKIANNL